MLSSARILHLHDTLNTLWHQTDASPLDAGTTIEDCVIAQHWQNFALWHEEDKARDAHASDAQIATVKRQIDQLNQQRNDLTERCDELLLSFLCEQGLPLFGAELHTETPGMILDRLSILSLKRYHTLEQTERSDVDSEHIARNRDRLQTLEEQRSDLANSLDVLWQRILNGERGFKVYRQLKMYNDATLNPVLYNAKR
jgi:hypothetical protein